MSSRLVIDITPKGRDKIGRALFSCDLVEYGNDHETVVAVGNMTEGPIKGLRPLIEIMLNDCGAVTGERKPFGERGEWPVEHREPAASPF